MQMDTQRVDADRVLEADRIWDESEVADYFGYSRRTIRRWRLMGALPYVRLPGGRLAYRATAIKRVVDTWESR